MKYFKSWLIGVLVSMPALLLSQTTLPVNNVVRPVLGVGYSTSGITSAWLTLGSNVFFLYEVGFDSSPDKSIYHPLLNLSETRVWNDEPREDIVKRLFWSVGVGTYIIPQAAGFINVSMTRINIRYQFVDETHTLSNPNGLYSFPKSTGGNVSCSVGGVFKISSRLALKGDVSILHSHIQEWRGGVGYIF